MTGNDTPTPTFDLEQAARNLAFDVRQYLGTYAEGNTFHAALGQEADYAINKGLRAAYEAGKALRPPATPAPAETRVETVQERNKRMGWGCKCHGETFCPDLVCIGYEDDVPVYVRKDSEEGKRALAQRKESLPFDLDQEVKEVWLSGPTRAAIVKVVRAAYEAGLAAGRQDGLF